MSHKERKEAKRSKLRKSREGQKGIRTSPEDMRYEMMSSKGPLSLKAMEERKRRTSKIKESVDKIEAVDFLGGRRKRISGKKNRRKSQRKSNKK